MRKGPPSSPAPAAVSPAMIRSGLVQNLIQYNSFSARAKVDFTSPTASQKGIAAYIRLQKDSAIWISVRPVLGIELVRLLITPDSVKMINFFNKTITLRSADSMQQLLHIPYGFQALQDLILGNPVSLPQTVDSIVVDTASSSIRFSSRRDDITTGYTVASGTYLLASYRMTESGGEGRSSSERFADYKTVQGRHFSGDRRIIVRSPRETMLDIRFTRPEFDQPLDFPFPEVDKFTIR
jgi:hypothetical protein